MVAEDLAEDRLGLRLVGQGEDGGGVGVVDELVGDEGVQQRLHRRVRGGGIQQQLALGRDHVLVREALQGAQLHQGLQAHGRMAGRLDLAKVPARALDAEHLDILAEHVASPRLHRGVAAAVQHQPRVPAEQPGGVGAQGQVFADALAGVAFDGRKGVLVAPETFHQAARSSPPNREIRPASEAGQTPRSVISPETSLAGVTSKP